MYPSNPTVTLELVNIKYDLVPAYQEDSFWGGSPTTYIPRSNNDWMSTDPHGFNETLTDKNGRNKNLIKPLIRLIKAWNAKANYPIESYSLEREIVNITYFCNTLEDYFFSFIDNMSRYRNTDTASTKVTSLKDNANRVRQALRANNITQAKTWLYHILP